jgi:hypothetical protein
MLTSTIPLNTLVEQLKCVIAVNYLLADSLDVLCRIAIKKLAYSILTVFLAIFLALREYKYLALKCRKTLELPY